LWLKPLAFRVKSFLSLKRAEFAPALHCVLSIPPVNAIKAKLDPESVNLTKTSLYFHYPHFYSKLSRRLVTMERKTPILGLKFLLSNWSLLGHTILAVALAVGVALVNGLVVNPSDAGRKSDGKTWLRASDVTTIVSAAATVVGLATSAWFSGAVWKSTFILMKNDLSLSQFKTMISISLPVRIMGLDAFVIAAVLILSYPATISQPLLTGAIDWTTTTVFKDAGSVPAYMGGTPEDWFYYLDAPQGSRNDGFAISALGVAAQTWSNVASSGWRCRHLGNAKSADTNTPIPVNSTVENAILPCIQIHNLTWDNIPWDPEVVDLLKNNATSLSLADSNPIGPEFWGGGQVFIYDLKPWDSPQKYLNANKTSAQLPNSTIFSGTKKVLLQLTRQKTNNCTQVTNTGFGNATFLSQIKNAYPLVQNPTDENCYLSGTISITAGVVKSPQSRFLTARAIEAIADNLQIEPSLWNEEVLFQMPDVMSRVSMVNPSGASRSNDVESYVAEILAVSYMAAWDIFFVESDNSTSTGDLKVNQLVNMLVARVDKIRVFSWLAISLLLVIFGVILLWLEFKRLGRWVTNGPAAALTIDTSSLKERDLTSLSAYSQYQNQNSAAAWRINIKPPSTDKVKPTSNIKEAPCTDKTKLTLV
jgi:hypothetical protein